MRVPDEVFWDNYFYHVELVKLRNGLPNRLTGSENFDSEDSDI